MKKVFVVILTVMMAVSLSISGFAASFVSSPSGNAAPTLVSGKFENDACTATLVVTAYSQRNKLSADAKAAIEAAYTSIKSANDVSSLNADLAALAKSKEIKGTNLAVSDLFDISYTGCDSHTGHGKVTVKLSAETLKDFVGLLHYVNGAWELVSGATVAGDEITFTVDSLSPFAIVVDATPDSPPTEDNGTLYLLIGVAALSLAAALICFKKSRKEGAN
jgi:hypothetical protein